MLYRNLKVNLHLTENCNYHCHYCFAKYDGRDMTFDDWKVVIDNLSDSKLVSAINLAGGEPLVYPDFMKVLEYGQSKGLLVCICFTGYSPGRTQKSIGFYRRWNLFRRRRV